MLPELPPATAPWTPITVLLESQGLAVLRNNGRYASLECGPQGGGHGHPDRLQLTLFADGVYWLPDPGTGSYVTPDLFWYRSCSRIGKPVDPVGKQRQLQAIRMSMSTALRAALETRVPSIVAQHRETLALEQDGDRGPRRRGRWQLREHFEQCPPGQG